MISLLVMLFACGDKSDEDTAVEEEVVEEATEESSEEDTGTEPEDSASEEE